MVTSSFSPEFAVAFAIFEFSVAAVVDIFRVHWPIKLLGPKERKAWYEATREAANKPPVDCGGGGGGR